MHSLLVEWTIIGYNALSRVVHFADAVTVPIHNKGLDAFDGYITPLHEK